MNSECCQLGSNVPLVVGITGHRDLAALKKDLVSGLEGAVKAVKQVVRNCKVVVGENTPIWLLTGLAEGADLLAVRAVEELVLEGELCDGMVEIYPVLPIDPEKFSSSTDFSSEFESEYWGRAGCISALEKYKRNLIVLPHCFQGDATRFTSPSFDWVNSTEEERALKGSLYLNVATFIAKYSNMIVALWDGKDSDGPGGTGDVVKLKTGHVINWPEGTKNPLYESVSDFDGQVGGIVCHIPVIRANERSNPDITSTLEPFLTKTFSALPYNCYICGKTAGNGSGWVSDFLGTEFHNLIKQLRIVNTPPRTPMVKSEYPAEVALKCGLQSQYEKYKNSDRKAGYFQLKYKRIIIGFIFSALLGFLGYELLGRYIGSALGITINILIIVSVVTCTALIWHTKKKNKKWYHLLNRGVAEALRIRGFLNLAGVKPSRAPLVPRRYRERYPILNQAVSIAEFEWWKGTVDKDLKKVQKHWLQNQLMFLEGNLTQRFEISYLTSFLFKKPYLSSELIVFCTKFIFKFAIALGLLLIGIQGQIMNVMFFRQDSLIPGISLPMAQTSLFLICLTIAWGGKARVEGAAAHFVLFSLRGAAVFALVWAALCSLYPSSMGVTLINLQSMVMMAVQFLLMSGALFALWGELANYGPKVSGYTALSELYRRANHIVEYSVKGTIEPETETMLLELAREAMQEHAEWHHFESVSDLKNK